MNRNSSSETSTCCQELQSKLDDARREIAALKLKIEFLEKNPTIAQGMRGERLIASITNLIRTERNASHDLENDRVRIEVKLAALRPVSRSNDSTMRWTWGKPFGQGGAKSYDRLLLVGEADVRHANEYLDPTSPYVLFDVPYGAVDSLSGRGGTAGRLIRLSSNPARVESIAGDLYRKYQVTAETLKARYSTFQQCEALPLAQAESQRRAASRLARTLGIFTKEY